MKHTICENIQDIKQEIGKVNLVVVSKYRTLQELEEVYSCGHLHFGENRVQELVSKAEVLPKDIKWHVIGHLQTNKVKYIAPFVHLIHSVDSFKLLKAINKEAIKADRIIPFLFQLHIAEEESKYGLSPSQLDEILASAEYRSLQNIKCQGLMGMATLTDSKSKICQEFESLNTLYTKHNEAENWDTLSMGMSGDYLTAIECGSTMIRVGSKVFN